MSEERKYFNQFTGIKGNEYDLSKEYGVGYTANTREPFYFDKEDYDKVRQYTWSARHDTRKKRDNSYYIEAHARKIEGGKKKQYRIHLHHLVLDIVDNGTKKSVIVDHINRNKADCRKENLRISNFRINNINKDKQISNTSGIIGVDYSTTNKTWVARICPKSGKRVALYQGKDKNKAIKARLNAEYFYYGNDAPQKDLFNEFEINQESTNQFIDRLDRNLRASNTSGITGVSWDKRTEKWVSYININKKHTTLYQGMNKERAVIARLEAEKEFFPKEKWQKHLWKEYGIKDD